MTQEIEWTKDPQPGPGWYAVHYCWDPQEGSFVGASQWIGEKWWTRAYATNLPIFQWSSQPFLTEADAEVWAEAHDCSW